jgi:hypothetical protein
MPDSNQPLWAAVTVPGDVDAVQRRPAHAPLPESLCLVIWAVMAALAWGVVAGALHFL